MQKNAKMFMRVLRPITTMTTVTMASSVLMLKRSSTFLMNRYKLTCTAAKARDAVAMMLVCFETIVLPRTVK